MRTQWKPWNFDTLSEKLIEDRFCLGEYSIVLPEAAI